MSAQPTEASELLDAMIDELERIHEVLGRRLFDDRRFAIQEAVLQIAAMASRNLRAASHLIEVGWVPECGALVRQSYELARDAAFLLSQAGEARKTFAGRFIASRLLRLPGLDLNELSEDARRKVEQAEAAFGHPKARKPGEHWSGLDKRIVDETADAYFQQLLGPHDHKDLRNIVFDLGSRIAHADPGAWGLYPLDRDPRTGGRIFLQPGRKSPVGWQLTACLAAHLVGITVAQRLPLEERERLGSLFASLEGVLESHRDGSIFTEAT